MAEIILSEKDIERFWSKVRKGGPNECWEWLPKARSGQMGYGTMRINDRPCYAHRVSWVLHNQKQIPGGMCVLHGCDAPRCVNPSHLRVGSQGDNVKDMKARGRTLVGERNPRNILSEDQVREIVKRIEAREVRRETAKAFGISEGTIQSIAQGRIWKHVTGGISREYGRRAGAIHKDAKHGPDVAKRVLELRATGMTTRAIAIAMGYQVNFHTTVARMIRGAHWSVK